MPQYDYSDWNLWEPHIHTPGTALNDGFRGKWDEYFQLIEEANPTPVALGVTDYLSIRGYREFLTRRPPGHAPDLVLVFPNIEFRLTPATSKGQPLNAHILVSPDDPAHAELIEDALGRLSITTPKQTVSCTYSNLVSLGRAHLQNRAAEEACYRKGVEQFKVDATDFLRWYEKEVWLRENSLLGLAGGNDGLAGLRKDSGFLQYHDALVTKAHFLFSAQPSDREYYAGRGSALASAIEDRYGGLKPAIHGSDAHDLSKVLQPDLDRFCWIKAAPTFDGLRQLLLEPWDRVHLGKQPPPRPDPNQTLQSIDIDCPNDWFDSATIPLTPGLCAIIGEKGSGKTALADLIAAAAGAWEDNAASFLSKARDHVSGTKVTLTWGSERRTECRLGEMYGENIFPEVRYLSQQFVERLCSTDVMAVELVREVERVVFDHIPPSERLNSANFDELRRKRTSAMAVEREEIRQSLAELNEQLEQLRLAKERLPKLRSDLKAKELEEKALNERLRKLVSQKTATVAEVIERLRSKRDELEQQAGKVQERATKLEDLRGRVLRLEGRFTDLFDQLKTDLAASGVPIESWPEFKVAFAGRPLEPLGRHQEVLATQYRAIVGGADDPPDSQTVHTLNAALKKEEQKLQLDEARRRQVAKEQRAAGTLRTQIQQLKDEIEAIEKGDAEERPKVRERRDGAYFRYFQLLEQEKTALTRLYEPLRSDLSNRTTGERDLDFEVVTTVDVAAWAAVGEAMLDLRRSGPFMSRGALEETAKALLGSAWSTGDTETIKAGLGTIADGIREGGFKQKLRQGYTARDVAAWLYSVEHIKLEYGLKYRERRLRYLSPGTRGIVLLILFLAVDTLDDRPLLIDQPEENLDNASVYAVLVQYFREAKRRRQIIVVTHNPNLVVNTDAEQVIIASADRQSDGMPAISYAFGPLEHAAHLESADPVKHQVCSILEGGRTAFRNRQRRYS